jgi:hypothetical protein
VIALSRAGRGREDGGVLTNMPHKPNLYCYYESPLYNEYILMRKFIIKNKTSEKFNLKIK